MGFEWFRGTLQVLKTQMQSSSGNVTMKEADSWERRISENSQNCVRCAESTKIPTYLVCIKNSLVI